MQATDHKTWHSKAFLCHLL